MDIIRKFKYWLDNNDVPEGLDMVLPDSYLAGMTLAQIGINGRADSLLSNLQTEIEASVQSASNLFR